MEIFISIILVLILLETSYLTYRLTQKNTGSKGDVLLDTSVLIDGRILAIANSGLLSSRLLVPQSVVRELQFMADKADHDKRERARYGLEVIEKLQQTPHVTLDVINDGLTSEHGVDEQLIILAQRTGAKLCTIDYNLNKAARVQSVEVVNINELAHALRVIHLPGETIEVALVQPGQDKKQAVGYLDDGTMVVVDDSRELIGQSVVVEITRALQTTAGRMMFAKRTSPSRKSSSDESQRRAKTEQPNVQQTTSTAPAPSPRRTRTETSGRSHTQRRDTRHMPTKPIEATDPTPAPELQKASSKPARGRSNSRRPRSAEDTLVTLANK